MSKRSIEYLEKISGMKYVSISEPAHHIKETFQDYFTGDESDDLPESFKEKVLDKISSTDISIEEIVEEIAEEIAQKWDDDEVDVEYIYRDLDSVSRSLDKVWFSDFVSISRLHITKKKLRKMFEEYIGKEVKSFEIDNIETFGDAIRFLDTKSQSGIIISDNATIDHR